MHMQTHATFEKQRGVVLFITLVALVVLLLAAVALIRSTDTSVLISGNLAVKRDLTNEAEKAIALAVTKFSSGGALDAEGTRWQNLPTANYSASTLSSNAQGVPNILFDSDANFAAQFSAAAPTSYNGVSYRYVVDRLCPIAGDPNPSNQHCVTDNSVSDLGGNARNPTLNGGTGSPSTPSAVVYRISVRVTDARLTQSFVQTTFKSFGS